MEIHDSKHYPLRALVPLTERSAYQRAAYHVFDHVTASQEGRPIVSFLGTVLSDYPSGPSLFWLADAAAAATGLSGYFGLHSTRRL